jgi:hypothetical protein
VSDAPGWFAVLQATQQQQQQQGAQVLGAPIVPNLDRDLLEDAGANPPRGSLAPGARGSRVRVSRSVWQGVSVAIQTKSLAWAAHTEVRPGIQYAYALVRHRPADLCKQASSN